VTICSENGPDDDVHIAQPLHLIYTCSCLLSTYIDKVWGNLILNTFIVLIGVKQVIPLTPAPVLDIITD